MTLWITLPGLISLQCSHSWLPRLSSSSVFLRGMNLVSNLYNLSLSSHVHLIRLCKTRRIRASRANIPIIFESSIFCQKQHNGNNHTWSNITQVLDARNIMDTDDCNGNRRWVILKITVIFLLRHSLKGIGRLKMRNEPGYIELSGGNSTLLKAIKYLINWFVVILVSFWVFDKLIKSN